MRRVLSMLVATVLPLHAQVPTSETTGNPVRVISNYVAAIGGEAAIRKTRSQHVIAEVELPAQAIRGTVESRATTPDMFRVRTALPGYGSTESGYDGSIGWSLSEVAGGQLLIGKQLDQLRESANLLAPLHENARSLTWGGVREFDGRKCAVIAVVSQFGDSSTKYFDLESHLLIGMEQRIATPGGDVPVSISFSDYRRFGELLVASTVTQRLPGGQVMVSRIKSIDERPIDPSEFIAPESVRRLIRKPPA